MNMSAANIVRIIALILALAGAFVVIPFIGLAFVVLGLAVGFIGVSEERRISYFVTAIALTMMVGALGPIPVVGESLTAILTNISSVINAGAIAIVLTSIYERVTEQA
jgi:hypothetical protein